MHRPKLTVRGDHKTDHICFVLKIKNLILHHKVVKYMKRVSDILLKKSHSPNDIIIFHQLSIEFWNLLTCRFREFSRATIVWIKSCASRSETSPLRKFPRSQEKPTAVKPILKFSNSWKYCVLKKSNSTVSVSVSNKNLSSKYFNFYLGIFRDVQGRVIELGRKEAIESTTTGQCVRVNLYWINFCVKYH